MTRLIAGLTVLVLAALAPLASAQTQNPQHLGFFAPQALEGAFQGGAGSGKLAFLAIASPRGCNDGSSATLCPHPVRVYFYDQACTRVTSVAAPLSQNGARLLPLHALTTVGSGNFLVAKGHSATSAKVTADQALRTPVVGTLFQLDVNRGIGWSEPLSHMSGDSGNGWSPYRPIGIAPFLPPDAGGFQVTLRFRCPTGVALLIPAEGGIPEDFSSRLDKFKGTEGTLGGDMIEALSQSNGNLPGTGYFPALDDSSAVGPADLCGSCRSVNTGGISGFATSLTVHAFDTNENPIATVAGLPCSCFTEARLSTVVPAAATQQTYLLIEGFAPRNLGAGETAGAFAGSWQVQVAAVAGQNLFVSRRFHNTPNKALLSPEF